MTMVPAQNLFKHNNNFGSYGDGYTGYEYYDREACLGSSDLALVDGYMAEDESRTNSVNDGDLENNKDERWLQLGLGGSESSNITRRRRSRELVELDLLPTPHIRSLSPSQHVMTCSGNSNINSTSTVPLLLQHQHQRTTSFGLFPHQYYSSSPSWNAISSSLVVSPWNNVCYSSHQPFQYQGGGGGGGGGGFDHMGAGPSSDMRVIDAPSNRQNSGVWFVLQASSIQAKEPFLPQIPRSYLRIKDGRMTIGLVMKYLVNKLQLNSVSEIEITCRGLQLLPFLTLVHVRDTIWNSRTDAVTLLSDSSTTTTTDHLMILCYGRSA